MLKETASVIEASVIHYRIIIGDQWPLHPWSQPICILKIFRQNTYIYIEYL